MSLEAFSCMLGLGAAGILATLVAVGGWPAWVTPLLIAALMARHYMTADRI